MSRESAGILLYDRDWILLVRHTAYARLPTGSYGFPAGKLEPGESAVEAAARELPEETGLRGNLEDFLHLSRKMGLVHFKDGMEETCFNLVYCRRFSGELRESDKTVPCWTRVSGLDSLYLVSDDIPVIARSYSPSFSHLPDLLATWLSSI